MENSAVAKSIAFILGNFTAVTFVLALVFAALGRKRPAADRYLRWLLLLPIGLGGLWSGIYHVAFPEVAAHFIGWQNSPFQFEVGMADLGIGVAGCVAFWASYGFQAATVLISAIFFLGDAIGHIHQMMQTSNFSPGNAGSVFYIDIILPVTTIALVLMLKRREVAGFAN